MRDSSQSGLYNVRGEVTVSRHHRGQVSHVTRHKLGLLASYSFQVRNLPSHGFSDGGTKGYPRDRSRGVLAHVLLRLGTFLVLDLILL
jgi:hypothetical protein